MPGQSPETYVAWATGFLFAGCGLAIIGGMWILSRARRLPYHQLRRQALLQGWRLLFAGAGLLLAAGLVERFGPPLLGMVAPPTPTRLPTSTPSAAFRAGPSSTFVPTPSSTPTPSPGPTRPPTQALTPTLTPTPALPWSFITPPGTVAVTPLPEAVAANLRFSLQNDCTVSSSLDHFNSKPLKIFAHFYYDHWLPGVQWSGVWYHNGQVFFVETLIWADSTGGCGFTNYDNQGQPWPEGHYEVQIFIGERWLLSNQFTVNAAATVTPIQVLQPGQATALPALGEFLKLIRGRDGTSP